ncbi:MAG: hypothetical protein P8H59_07100 [Flavobacteriales bacterium]|nr:hypothetical protein [Flavobacteriales bacterium]MDG1780700.1 hypothetical protein [Flavobacteriales bacterium]
MRLLLVFIIALSSYVAAAQVNTGYQQWDPLTQTAAGIHNTQAHHANIRPLSPFLDTLEVYQTGDSAIIYGTEKLRVNWAPVLDLNIGGSTSPTPGLAGFGNGGAQFQAYFKDRFYARASYQAAYLYFPDHLQLFAKNRQVLPGIGEAVNVGDAYLAHYYTGAIGMRMGDHFELEVGRDKHFWGDGYRSMILSTNSSPFPYARLTTKVWKVKYTNLWSALTDLNTTTGEKRRKFTTHHALSWNITQRFNLSVYEAVVWQASDTLSDRGFEAAYLNPLIFYRPVEFAQGSADNVLLGLSMRYELEDDIQLYAQLYFDEFLMDELRSGDGWWGNKFGVQLGAKAYNLFADSLMLQTELNIARPYTYTHGSVIQAYGHMNQSLAHPLGTNFVEWISRASYQLEDYTFNANFMFAGFGDDKEGENYGGDVFISYANPATIYGNTLMQGEKNTLLFVHLEAEKKFIEAYDINLTAGIGIRKVFNTIGSPMDAWVTLGLRTPMFRSYRDF